MHKSYSSLVNIFIFLFFQKIYYSWFTNDCTSEANLGLLERRALRDHLLPPAASPFRQGNESPERCRPCPESHSPMWLVCEYRFSQPVCPTNPLPPTYRRVVLNLGDWPPKEHLAISGDIFGFSTQGGVVRRQGCSQTSSKSRDGLLLQNSPDSRC